MHQGDEPQSADGVRRRPITASWESLRVPYSPSRACLSRWFDHRFSICVNQGSDPSDPAAPYQALAIRERHAFPRVRPLETKEFSAREPGAVEIYSLDPVDCIAPTPRRAYTS